jgi:ATP adenylyltransferase
VSDCLICAKHRGEGSLKGQLVARTDGFWIYHAPADDDGWAPLGYLFIESDRHAPALADLTDDEAAALGRLRVRLALALRATLEADHVLSFVIGLRIPHFHEHLVTRHRGTPSDLSWDRSYEGAPKADDQEVAALCMRIAGIIDPG